MSGFAVKAYREATQEFRAVLDASWCEVDETFHEDQPEPIPPRPSACHVWNSTSFAWVEDPTMKADADAEEVRVAAILSDTETANVYNFLRTNDADGIRDWITTNVTDLASARTLLIRLSLVCAVLVKHDNREGP